MDIDFTGGTSLRIVLTEEMDISNVRARLDKAFDEHFEAARKEDPKALRVGYTLQGVRLLEGDKEIENRSYTINSTLKLDESKALVRKTFVDDSGNSLLKVYSLKASISSNLAAKWKKRSPASGQWEPCSLHAGKICPEMTPLLLPAMISICWTG